MLCYLHEESGKKQTNSTAKSMYIHTQFHRFKQQRGQSIIEILIATLIVGLVLTAVASGLTLSIKNTSETRQRELANNFAQEGMEVFRKQRETAGWARFRDTLESNTYCLNSIPINFEEFTTMPLGECESGTAVAGTTLTRNAVVQVQSTEHIEVEVIVSWQEAQRENQVSIIQTFRNIR